MTCKKRTVLTDAVRKKKLGKLLEDYLAECRPPPDADPKHSGGSFPNLAGFCSYLGCGIDEFEALRTTDPATADYLSAALEDAALNRSPMLSPTVVSAYLKHRLGYGEKSEAVSSADAGEIRLIFDHDISEDGA
ncbi:MAG TPA: hypothetical protein DDW30_03330 [Clostridiales bacterium]|nr:hypothetical protein [Clostridiales bacterium]